jgi:hypothetical protein
VDTPTACAGQGTKAILVLALNRHFQPNYAEYRLNRLKENDTTIFCVGVGDRLSSWTAAI